MIVLKQSNEQLIIEADTRKTALYTVLGGIILCAVVYILISNSPFFPDNHAAITSITILVMIFCLGYFFYRVCRKVTYTFDKKATTLIMKTQTLFGTKQIVYPTTNLHSVETRKVATYAYHAQTAETSDVYHATKNENYYSTIVLHFARRREINLVPNAAYFFLHPFHRQNDVLEKGLGKTIADFLKVPLIDDQRSK